MRFTKRLLLQKLLLLICSLCVDADFHVNFRGYSIQTGPEL
jgi:hypothetical protein